MRWVSCLSIIIQCVIGSVGRAEEATVGLELVLAVDGSRSIDEAEFDLQIRGIAAAFRDPAFLNALDKAAPDGIAVTLVQWTGHADQVQVVDWSLVSGPATAADFADRVLAGGRRLQPGPTGIGSAIRYSYRLMEANEFLGKRQVIDISGDGYNNSGNRPELARDEAVGRGVVVNGLTVMNDIPLLDRYFLARVIGGPGAFVVEAENFAEFALAFRLKLIREVTGYTIGRSPPPQMPGSDDPLFAIGLPSRNSAVSEGREVE